MVQNKGLIFKKVPEGWPVAGQDLTIESRDFDLNQDPPKKGLVSFLSAYLASIVTNRPGLDGQELLHFLRPVPAWPHASSREKVLLASL
jgi:hypothetical protein